MTWEPHPTLHNALEQQVILHSEAIMRRLRRDGEEIATRLATEGLARSGGLTSAVCAANLKAFEDFGNAVASDILGVMREAYGDRIPVESTGWLRHFYQRSVGVKCAELIFSFTQYFLPQESPDADVDLRQSLSRLERDFAIELSKIEMRAELAQLTPPTRLTHRLHSAADAFVCHAPEDKQAVALPLAQALIAKGYTVWLDQFQLHLGDPLLEKIDDGLSSCGFGVVILSPSFFGKKWDRRELAGLAAREDAEDRNLILPIWYDIDQAGIAALSPTLAAVLGVDWAKGLDVVMSEIMKVLGDPTR